MKKKITICLLVIIQIFCLSIALKSSVVKVSSNNVPKRKVVVSGDACGIKLLASGVLVMGFDTIQTEEGEVYVADGVDLKIGDIILEVNDTKVETNVELMQKTKESNGEKMKLKVLRENKTHITYIKPVKSLMYNEYKLGLWVKDSSAGVGTVTFIDKNTNCFAALGHGITETKNNYILPILTGGLVKTSILDVNKGFKGKPGDLKGTLTNDLVAQINLNTKCGIYGKITDNSYITNGEEVEILEKEKVKEGKAEIICVISGNKKEKYEIEIEKVLPYSTSNKNMIIKITDKKLLEKTGGIVQGMSGSPIIQNGKLVGAVTHVFLNDPTKGYAVFATNMLKDIDKLN